MVPTSVSRLPVPFALLLVLCSGCLLRAQAAAPTAGGLVAQAVLGGAAERVQKLLEEKFAEAKFTNPHVTINQDSFMLDIVITGGDLNASPEGGQAVVELDLYNWQVSLVVSAVGDNLIDDDRIDVSVDVFHRHSNDGQPHPDDKAKGPTITDGPISFIANTIGKTNGPVAPSSPVPGPLLHPAGHTDRYQRPEAFANVQFDLGSFWEYNNEWSITSWKLHFVVHHLTNSVTSLSLAAAGEVPAVALATNRDGLVLMPQQVVSPNQGSNTVGVVADVTLQQSPALTNNWTNVLSVPKLIGPGATAEPHDFKFTPGTPLGFYRATSTRDFAGANLASNTLTGARFSGANLTGADLRQAVLDRAWLGAANLTEARLSGASLAAARLMGANLTGGNLFAANLARADLTGADLRGANLSEALLNHARLRSVLWDETTIISNKWRQVLEILSTNQDGRELPAANLSQAHLSRARLRQAVLSAADLSGSDLSEADLADAAARGMKAPGASFLNAVLARADLREASLQAAFLREADLRGANLGDAILDYADLGGAMLDEQTVISDKWRRVARLATEGARGLNLENADLARAKLRGVDFTGANLRGADLTGADLTGADLRQANLEAAILDFAALQDAQVDQETQLPAKWRLVTELLGGDNSGRDLAGRDLSHADLRGVSLREVNLAGADLRSSFLDGARFYLSALPGANLQNAQLTAAKFSRADLRETDFAGARLDRTVFYRSDLSGAFLDGLSAAHLLDTKLPDGITRSDMETHLDTDVRDAMLALGESIVFSTKLAAKFVGSPINNPPITYQWYRNGEAIPGATQESYTATADDAEAAYKCIATLFGQSFATQEGVVSTN